MKITGKALKRAGAVLALTAAAVLMACHAAYPIRLNTLTLPEYIKDYYNRGRSVALSPEIRLYGGVGLGNRELFYLLEIGEDLGVVTMEKGLTGRYRITRLSYGGGNFRDGIVESGGKKYLLFGGRDITRQIAKIAVSIDGVSYELENEFAEQARDRFLLYTEIDSRVEDSHIDRDRIVFYDERGEDITEAYDLSGGGI